MQKEVEVSSPALFFLKDFQGVVIGIPGVDADRQAGGAGGTDLHAEDVRLDVPRRAIIEVIQARFAYADDPGVAGKVDNRLLLRISASAA